MRYRVSWTKVTTERMSVEVEAPSGIAAIALAADMPEETLVTATSAVRTQPWFQAVPNDTETKALALDAHLASGGRVGVEEAMGWVEKGIIRPTEPSA